MRAAYKRHLAQLAKPVAPGTIVIYERRLEHFECSLGQHGEPLVLASITEENVEQWLENMPSGAIGRKCTEETVASSLSTMKTFTRKYLYKIRRSQGEISSSESSVSSQPFGWRSATRLRTYGPSWTSGRTATFAIGP